METPDQDTNRAGGDESSETVRLQEQLRREHDLYLRALADFENYRKRVDRDRAGVARSGKRDIILPLLSLLDDFDRALEHVSDAPPSVAEGLLAVQRKFLRLLEAQGITPLESVGARFDPALHDAIGTVESDEVESGAVAEELQRGYRWGDDVLRPARVRVAE
jgi:molecular chaperone GrpE